MATMRSPRAGRVAKGTSPRVGGKPASKVFSALTLDLQFCHLWYRHLIVKEGNFCWNKRSQVKCNGSARPEHSLLNFCAQPDETLRGKRRSSYGIKKDKKVALCSNMAAVTF